MRKYSRPRIINNTYSWKIFFSSSLEIQNCKNQIFNFSLFFCFLILHRVLDWQMGAKNNPPYIPRVDLIILGIRDTYEWAGLESGPRIFPRARAARGGNVRRDLARSNKISRWRGDRQIDAIGVLFIALTHAYFGKSGWNRVAIKMRHELQNHPRLLPRV